MSAVTRLTLVAHAVTDAVRHARFPADEPLDPLGLRSIATVGALPGADRAAVYCGPETRTRQTAQSLGLSATPDDALRDLDCGHWAGLPMTATDPADLTAWLTDPTYRAHGGESLTDLLARTHTWLTTLENRGDPIIAITHPAVARAAILTTLDAPAKSFWRIDIPPLTTITLHHRPPAWTLRTTPHPVIRRPCSTAPDAGG